MEKKYSVIKDFFEAVRKDGKVIRGMIFRPDQEGESFPAVIFSHGFGSNYSELIHHGDEYSQNGIVIVFFDFCGGGFTSTSEGIMSEMTVDTEVMDLNTVLDKVIELPYVDKSSVYLQGESMGGLVTAMVAAKRKDDIKGIVLWYPAFIIPDDAKKRRKTGNTTIFGYVVSEEFDRAAIGLDVAKYQKAFDKPVLIVHGDKDSVVPLSYSSEAVKNYHDVTLKVIPGAGHGFDGEDSKSARRMSLSFVMECEKE